MKPVRLIIAYDGTGYRGWQKNRELPTIERELELVLTRITNHPIELHVASRTDSGVHARGQVARFHTDRDLNTLQRSANGLLPPSVRILELTEAAPDWHPTFDALGKEYHYLISNCTVQIPQQRNYAWLLRQPLDINAMREAAEHLIGEHDYAAFVNEKSRYAYEDCISRIDSIQIDAGSPLCIRVVGKRFLYKMMRNLVGSLVDIGRGRLPGNVIPELLESGKRPAAGVCAPAHGLYLHAVNY